MPHLSIEAKRRAVSLYSRGYSVLAIFQRLQQENVDVSKRAIYSLVEKWRVKGSELPLNISQAILNSLRKRQKIKWMASRDKLIIIKIFININNLYQYIYNILKFIFTASEILVRGGSTSADG